MNNIDKVNTTFMAHCTIKLQNYRIMLQCAFKFFTAQLKVTFISSL